jgi:hypothetical protein
VRRALHAVALAAPLLLGGCGLAPAVIISGIGLGVTIADKVVGIDVALTQDTPGKTPIATVVAPVVPALLP